MVGSFPGWRGNDEDFVEEVLRLPVVGRMGTEGEQVRRGKPRFSPGCLRPCKLHAPCVESGAKGENGAHGRTCSLSLGLATLVMNIGREDAQKTQLLGTSAFRGSEGRGHRSVFFPREEH